MEQEFLDRRRWFDVQWPRLENCCSLWRFLTWVLPVDIRANHTCPCCGYPTLADRYRYEICGLCEWEDDGQDDADMNETSVPNSRPDGTGYTLYEARRNFADKYTKYAHNKTESIVPSSVTVKQRKEVIDALNELFYAARSG